MSFKSTINKAKRFKQTSVFTEIYNYNHESTLNRHQNRPTSKYSTWYISNKSSVKKTLVLGKLYNAQIKNGSISLENAMAAFLIGIKATDPPNAPNYLVIPHVIDQYVPSNTSTKGLIGYDLLQKALESFCKKSSSRKAAIRQAHQTIFHSANN